MPDRVLIVVAKTLCFTGVDVKTGRVGLTFRAWGDRLCGRVERARILSIALTRYGRRELIVSTVIAASLEALGVAGMVRLHWAWVFVLLPVGAVWGWVLWFFRDPDRKTPRGEGLFICPADGNVADVTQVGPDSVLGVRGVKVGIFMNVVSVHVNRSPADAVVVKWEHHKGVFLDARDPEAAFRNESATVHLSYSYKGKDYPLVVRQVAGLVARRIVTDVSEGQKLVAGERFGMIKFGSRVELFVPDELAGDIRARTAQRVCAGSTVLVAVEKEPA
jgi:phosphatidylserine decarboxylase